MKMVKGGNNWRRDRALYLFAADREDYICLHWVAIEHEMPHLKMKSQSVQEEGGLSSIYYMFGDDRVDYIYQRKSNISTSRCHRKWNDYICLHRDVMENEMIHALVDKVPTDEGAILPNLN